jgi:hypothetical protein
MGGCVKNKDDAAAQGLFNPETTKSLSSEAFYLESTSNNSNTASKEDFIKK